MTCLLQSSVFQPFHWSGTLCSNFDCSRNPCLFGRGLLRPEGPKFEDKGWQQVLQRVPAGFGEVLTANMFWTY